MFVSFGKITRCLNSQQTIRRPVSLISRNVVNKTNLSYFQRRSLSNFLITDIVLLGVFGEALNAAAYAFAPAILVTPLGALSVLIG